jgi:adenylate cyclase
MTRAEQWQAVRHMALRYGPLAALIGLVPGYFIGDGSILAVVTGGLIGLLIGTGMVVFEVSWGIGLIPRAWREAPFLTVVLTKSLVWLVIIVVGLALPLSTLGGSPRDALVDSDFVVSIVVSFGVAAVMNLIFQVNQLMGRGVLLRLILGRYHRPREETRIFLFIDLRGSTAIAESLGNLRYHGLLRRFIADITPPIVRFGGEIHRYVGDQVIVTWTRDEGLADAACVRCGFAMADAIERNRARYLSEFGVTPAFWAGLHMGEIVSGEIGAVKHEIVYLGDTMNATARIEQACREFDRPFVVSSDVVDALTLPNDTAAESLGAVTLRGFAAPLDLFALSRR